MRSSNRTNLLLRTAMSSQVRTRGKSLPPLSQSSSLISSSQYHPPCLAPRTYHSTVPTARKTALVLGSSGCLGSTVSRHLTQNLNMSVIGADVVSSSQRPADKAPDRDLDDFVPLPHFDTNPTLGEVAKRLTLGVGECIGGNDRGLDVVIIASGGWEGDPPRLQGEAADTQKEMEDAAVRYGDVIERMMRMNLYPVVAAGFAASRYMANEGLFVVIGAAAALAPTPGMMGYGLSKCSAHHFVQTLGAITGKAATKPKSKKKKSNLKDLRRHDEYLDTLSCVGILPTMIDTPSNREASPDADFDDWTKPIDIAKEIGAWIEKPDLRPHSGSLIKVLPTGDGESGATFRLVR